MANFTFKKKGRLPPLPGERPRSPIPEVTSNERNDLPVNDSPELFDDEEITIEAPPLKQKVIHEKPSKPAAIPECDTTPETSRLSLSIDRTLHRRLKLEAVKQDHTIISMIESWIEENCPEV